MNFFIQRPAFTIVLMLILTLTGLISYANLPVRWIPNVTPPIISIATHYTGASANLVESAITTPLESALSGIDGITSLTSSSRQNESEITLNFKLGRNLDAVVEDVRSALARVTGSLPRDVNAPVVAKADTDSMPILYLAFSAATQSAKEVSDYVTQFILPRLQTVDGVAMINTFGMHVSAMRIWLDPAKMAASKVTVDDVTNSLQEQNIEVPSGHLRGDKRFYNIVTNETLTSADQFNDLIVRAEPNQAVVRIKNIGAAIVAPADEDSAFRVMGKPAVALGIVPQAATNPLTVSRNVIAAFNEITQSLPKGMHSSIVYNEANFIQDSVHSVYEGLFEAVLFVLLVILAFLGNWRATLVPMVTIPVCLIATFTLLALAKFSINTITLMAFVLAIGLVVDDAIVMLENISRHIEAGMSPFAAALKGSQEMIFPVIAMTLTLAAVYTPIAFTAGLLGAVFSEFALTLAGAVLVSGLVALTLTPMMCARLLVGENKAGRYTLWLNARFKKLQQAYQTVLLRVLQQRIRVLVLLAVLTVGGVYIYHVMPSELAPMEDRNEIQVYVSAPNDASFTYTDDYAHKLELLYNNVPELDTYISVVGYGGPASAFQLISLKPWYKRSRSTAAIAAALNTEFKQFAGVTAMAAVPPPPLTWFTGSDGASVAMAVQSAGSYAEIYRTMQNLVAVAKKYPGFAYVDNQLKWDRDQFEINIDREKAADMQIPMANITNTISAMLAGRNVGKFEFDGKQYDVMVQVNQAAQSNPDLIKQLYVKSNNNTMLSLADLTNMHETSNPGILPHYERMRADTLFAGLAPGYTMGDAVLALQKIARATLPDTMKIAFEGEAKNFLESSHKMALTFLLALVFIYLVLVAQFESFIDPFIILLTVPFAVIGALLTLKLSGGSLNIYSNIGLVTLIGLIAKHGILMTEFANQTRLAGAAIQDAIIAAALLRLRPILMTTASMVLGALPLAFALGAGAETRHQVGWVIVGGMVIGTFFSLIIVPIAYTYLATFKRVALVERVEVGGLRA